MKNPPPIVLHPEWVWTDNGLRTGQCVVFTTHGIVEVVERERHPDGIAMPGKLLLPGFVNAHSHAFQRAFRGHVQFKPAGRSDFWSWRERMYAVANGLDPDGVEAVSRLAFLEMAEAGFTSVGEFHYLHRTAEGVPYADPDELARRVIRAALSVGIRIALLRVVYARGGIGVPLGAEQQRFRTDSAEEALRAVEALQTPDPRVLVGLAPHSIRAVPVEWLPELAAFEGVVHAHVSEQTSEVRSTIEALGRTPLRAFADAGLVDARFTAVHLTHPSPDDLALMADRGARIAVCPTTELDLGDGFLPVEARSLPLCLGSDSQARIDGFAEARALEMHARGVARRRNVMSPVGERHGLAERLLRCLTVEGARAIGLDAGSIRAGAPADLVAVDLDQTGAFGAPPLEAAVFNGSPDWVSDVWVGGAQIVSDGRHPRRREILDAAASYL